MPPSASSRFGTGATGRAPACLVVRDADHPRRLVAARPAGDSRLRGDTRRHREAVARTRETSSAEAAHPPLLLPLTCRPRCALLSPRASARAGGTSYRRVAEARSFSSLVVAQRAVFGPLRCPSGARLRRQLVVGDRNAKVG